MPGIEYKRNDTKCALCRLCEADEVGSHLAPNFLIHSAFSFDGSGPRDREIVAREHINDPVRPIYYGRCVAPEAIDADHGGELSDEEADNNINLLVYDHLFCKDCEKRFGLLEQEYRQFYANPSKKLSSMMAYLFWRSVFWRMSVGYMAILLGIEDELKIRSVLDKTITTKREIEQLSDSLGDFGYVIWRTKGIKKGYSGILGTRTLKSPYLIILNDLVVMLLSNISKMEFPFQYGCLEVTEDMINRADKTVMTTYISLEQFARIKRFVLDQPIIDSWGPLYEKGLRYFREEDRATGRAHSNEIEKRTLDELSELDNLSPRQSLETRYLAVMNFGELKRHAAKRLGEDYDMLKDDTMFLFPFDIENYKRDCRKLATMGFDPFMLPFADCYLLSKKQMDNRRRMKQRWAFYENQLDCYLNRGYTLKDIVYDNMRTKGMQ